MNDWPKVRLGEICEIIDGDRGKNYPQQEEFASKGYCLFLNASNVTKNGWSFNSNQFITKEKSSLLRKGIVEVNDIVFTTRGTVGNVAHYKRAEFDCVRINSGMVILRHREDDNRYLYYALKSKSIQQQILLYCSGSAQPQLPIRDLRKVQIPLPPLATQRAIAKRLSAYDNLIENNTKRIAILERMAEQLYKEWFVRRRFPGHGAAATCTERAEDLFDITIGKTPPRKEFHWFSSCDSDAINWVSISDMKGMYIFGTKEQLTKAAISRFNITVVPKGTILLSFKLTVGRVAIAAMPCATNEAIAHFKITNATHREYLYFFLKNFEYSRLGNTSAIGNAINSSIVRNMEIEIPDECMLAAFHERVKPMFEMVLNLQRQNALLAKERDLLLPRLMSGKLEVKV